ncbi:TPA: hypothetical protein ACH3X1_011239 [Trebouxia sp. C0004]
MFSSVKALSRSASNPSEYNLTGTERLSSAWVADQHWSRGHAQDTKQCCFAPVLSNNRAVWGAKPHRCNCKGRKGCLQLGCRPALEQRVCSHPLAVHCNTAQGKTHSPMLNAALQSSLTAGVQ